MPVTVATIAALVAVCGVFAVGAWLYGRHGASDLEWCGYHAGEVVVVSSVYHSGGRRPSYRTGRITWLDPATGARTRRASTPARCRVRIQRDNLVVVDAIGAADRSAGVIDLATGDVVTGATGFRTVSPGLARDGVEAVRFDAAAERFEVIAGTGEKVVVELAALGRREAAGAAPRAPAGKPRFRVEPDREHAFFRLRYGGAVVGEQRLLAPVILWQDDASCVIKHQVAMAALAEVQVSKLTAAGAVAWTVTQAELDLAPDRTTPIQASAPAIAVDGLVIIAFDARRDRIVALDPASGAVRWKVGV